MNERLEVDMSLRLYNYVCHKIGTENVVTARRVYFATIDCLENTNEITRITSGSKAEGLDLEGSDIDLMFLFNFVCIQEKMSEEFDDKPATFVMMTEDTNPGFTQLKLRSVLLSKLSKQLLPWCIPCGQEYFLSSRKIKKWAHSQWHDPFCSGKSLMLHGPCLSNLDQTFDLVLCLRCKTWIEQAKNWVNRSRVWPSANLVSDIQAYGVLFVPIGQKGSPKEKLEWRISFSIAEKQLIFSFNHTQLLCYALLKVLLKEVIDLDANLQGLLCSYFIKTIIFWVSEEIPIANWKPDNLISCFMNCFGRLLYSVKYSILPHYFITEKNLFENKFDYSEKEALEYALSELYKRQQWCFIQAKLMKDFFQSYHKISRQFYRSKLDIFVDRINALKHFRNPHIVGYGEDNRLSKTNFRACNTHLMLFTFYSWFYQICLRTSNKILGQRTSSHKYKYKKYKQYFPYLILGMRCNAVSGWIYLASYFYCTEGYTLTLKLLDYILTKCTTILLGLILHMQKLTIALESLTVCYTNLKRLNHASGVLSGWTR